MDKERKKKNHKGPHEKKYSQQDVSKAIGAVEAGASIRGAYLRFNVPRSTLYTTINSVVPIKPGRHWYESFYRRYPEISLRVAQNLTARQVSATKDDLMHWFKQVQEHFDKINLKDVDPSRVFNLDERAFFLCPKGDKVLARKGSRSIYKVVAGNEKESITVLFTVSGNKVTLPPFLLFWYERLPSNIINSLPSGWICGNTDKGWKTADSFLNTFLDSFIFGC